MGLVVVSHSRALAEAAVALAREVLHDSDVAVEVAAGLDDGALGTDAAAIAEAVAAADAGDGVVVLMDLGSAVLSAELALELLDEPGRSGVVLCPAPLVEGLVGAAVAAAGGASRDEVAAEALRGLEAKQAHLGAAPPAPGAPAQAPAPATDGPVDAGEASGSFEVVGAHGLHARPAALLVREAAAWPATLEIRNETTGGAWTSAKSLSRVAALGAQRGHVVLVRATGETADRAVAAVVALARTGFGERPGPDARPGAVTPDAAASGAAASASPAAGPVGASPGVALAPVRQAVAVPVHVPDGAGAGPEVERPRLEAALVAAREEVGRTRALTAREVGEAEAALFDAHLLLLDDPDLVDEARRRTAEGEAAAAAWAAAVDRVQADLAALTDPYLRARAADVRAVGDVVLRELTGTQEGAAQGPPAAAGAEVLVADDLTPAQAAGLDRARVAGVALASGSPTSHAAILLRARGIPAVLGAGPSVLALPDGVLVALDGSTGELVVDPSGPVLERLRRRADAAAERDRDAARSACQVAVTRDGQQVPVGANLSTVEDARLAASAGADLAGLVRTEFLFLGRDAPPDVDEQVDVYRQLGQALDGRRLVLRTLDVGGDKPLPYLPVPGEDNPFLGVRGLRLSLARPGLLADQLLAVVRVAHDHPVSVMFPMVSTLAELLAAREVLDAAVDRDGRGRPSSLQVGMMVEVPAAALKTAAFAPHVDFLSIGTNDLTQYALAADRGNAALTGMADPCDPGVLRLVERVCAGAGAALVAVCGELAADPRATGLLLGLGVRELSVGPAAVPAVKQAVRAVDLAAAGRLAAAALTADGPEQVRALLPSDEAAAGG